MLGSRKNPDDYRFATMSIPKAPAEKPARTYGRIILLGPKNPTDVLKQQVFSRQLPIEFTVRGVEVDSELGVDNNLVDIELALDYSAGLLVIEPTDESLDVQSFTHQLQRSALKYARQQTIPVLLLLRSSRHACSLLLGEPVCSGIQAVFCDFESSARLNASGFTGSFPGVKPGHLMFSGQWRYPQQVDECLRAVVRKVG